MEQNPRKWAEQNLSPARARSFWKAYQELERGKFSALWYAENRKEDALRLTFVRAQMEQTEAIQARANAEANDLERQAQELLKKAREIRHEAQEEVYAIQAKVYESEEYKAQRAKISELWHREVEAFQPKAKALMDKYLKAQEASK